MWRYVVKRILALIPVIIAISLLVFIMIDLAPGNAIDVIAGGYSEEAYDELVHELGYDRSVFYRYYLYVRGIFRGSFGTSVLFKQDVLVLYAQRFPTTLRLALISFVFALIVSLPLGVFAAVRRGSVSDNVATVLAVLGLSIPNFWLGLMLIVLFSLKLGWFPSGGTGHGIAGLILPMITIGTGQMAYITRTTRMSMVEALSSEYLLTARAKGVPERAIVYKHALRNALIPIITISGSAFCSAMGGSVLVESVFSLPGVGRLLVEGIQSRDTIVVVSTLVITTTIIAIVNLIVDLTYILADPRLHSQYIKPPKERKKMHKAHTAGRSDAA